MVNIVANVHSMISSTTNYVISVKFSYGLMIPLSYYLVACSLLVHYHRILVSGPHCTMWLCILFLPTNIVVELDRMSVMVSHINYCLSLDSIDLLWSVAVKKIWCRFKSFVVELLQELGKMMIRRVSQYTDLSHLIRIQPGWMASLLPSVKPPGR